MGDITYHVEAWRFHWKFWRPKYCIGGPMHFGWWATVKCSYSYGTSYRVDVCGRLVYRLRG